MKFIFWIVLSSGFVLFYTKTTSACSCYKPSFYQVTGNLISYIASDREGDTESGVLKEVDRKTFQVVEITNRTPSIPKKDRQNEGAFKKCNCVASQKFARDKNKVFFLFKPIPGANQEKFEPLDRVYSQDDKSVFYKTLKITDAEPGTVSFEEFDKVKIKLKIYCGAVALPDDKFCRNGEIMSAQEYKKKLKEGSGLLRFMYEGNLPKI